MELLDTLSLATKNRLINQYLNDEEFWRIRFEKDYPSDFDKVNKLKQRSWKDFSLLLIKYIDLSYGHYEEAMYYAAEGGHRDLVDFFISKGANNWNMAMYYAAERGHRDLVDFFISKGANSLKLAMDYAEKAGHRDLVDFLISKGAKDIFKI